VAAFCGRARNESATNILLGCPISVNRFKLPMHPENNWNCERHNVQSVLICLFI